MTIGKITKQRGEAAIATIKTATFGCSRETMKQIADVLGMTEEDLRATGLYRDVFDAARHLVVRRIQRKPWGAPDLYFGPV